MIIESSAPTRVDLAGGTIDIPPLFLFHEGAATVNFAVSLLAHCRIETRNDDLIVLESIDRGDRVETSLANIASLRDEPRLDLNINVAAEPVTDTGAPATSSMKAE